MLHPRHHTSFLSDNKLCISTQGSNQKNCCNEDFSLVWGVSQTLHPFKGSQPKYKSQLLSKTNPFELSSMLIKSIYTFITILTLKKLMFNQ